jgi:hypothetical protein
VTTLFFKKAGEAGGEERGVIKAYLVLFNTETFHSNSGMSAPIMMLRRVPMGKSRPL